MMWVNPPLLVVNDTVGTGATGIVATEGAFERIEVSWSRIWLCWYTNHSYNWW